jgi:Predicted phosphoesterase or phosphohydrolase
VQGTIFKENIMGNIWFISDQHHCHANILTFRNEVTGELIRPGFKDVDEMDETMIERYNSVVTDQCKVYFLGDVCFGNKEKLERIMRRLKGKKRLCLGNHDAQSYKITEYAKYFQKVMLWRQFKDMPYPFIACHVPMHTDGLYGRSCAWNVHGHIHERIVYTEFNMMSYIHGGLQEPDKRYINVCVEQTNYTPVHMDELQQRMKDSGLR